MSSSIVQVHIWNREYEAAREVIHAWRAESPSNKYAIYFAPQPAMMTGDWKEAKDLLDEALLLLPEDPLIISLEGVFWALQGRSKPRSTAWLRLAQVQNHLDTRTIPITRSLAFWPWQGDLKPLLSGWSEVSAQVSHAGHFL